MRVELLGIKGTWREVANAANTTIGKDAGTKEISSEWKRKILLCEHSPIRTLVIKAKIYELQYFVSVHLSRHKIGIEHFVKTSRTDRTGIQRGNQDALVDHEFEATAQAMINISRKRLCAKASDETRKAWIMVLDSIKDIEPELYRACVPECLYRGFCPEMKSCGFCNSPVYQKRLQQYRG